MTNQIILSVEAKLTSRFEKPENCYWSILWLTRPWHHQHQVTVQTLNVMQINCTAMTSSIKLKNLTNRKNFHMEVSTDINLTTILPKTPTNKDIEHVSKIGQITAALLNFSRQCSVCIAENNWKNPFIEFTFQPEAKSKVSPISIEDIKSFNTYRKCGKTKKFLKLPPRTTERAKIDFRWINPKKLISYRVLCA